MKQLSIPYYTIVLKHNERPQPIAAYKVTSPTQLANLVKNNFHLEQCTEEHMILLCLNTKNHVIGAFTVSIGSLSASVVHPREIFKRAMLLNSASIIMVHNHPSGVPDPSQEDDAITKRIKEAGTLLGINLLDHIIMAGDTYYSYKEGDAI